ncbi:chemotaxis protein CheW [Thiosulfativibrio zosterae]|uniref:Chemotaxis protein CheW n=1 Tax=Thiosulfativibrio zosterae TaxID=2675053 RepID=A0A6F8PN39_9GAMM|nr:chemotaxis protein CheW [Thiosulfativibrio zosterae]BBP43468.1 chemotaxis protein CheW [Thiosulfativibrio zosterae]
MATEKKEFLTFKLAREEFAVEINRVQEIRGWQVPSPLPNVPSFVKGVIDLRGTIVPILDLRDRFKLPASYNATTVVIVVHILTKQGERIVGLVVDAVSDVNEFDVNNLQAAPDISNSIDNQFILGLSTIFDSNSQSAAQVVSGQDAKPKKGRMVILVDIDSLASEGLIDQISSNADGVITGNG